MKKLIRDSLIMTALAVCTLFATHSANAAVIADLRGDYDTPSSPHTDGQTAAGRISDSVDQGDWTFFARTTAAPGGTETALVYSTSGNGGVRNPNAYVYTPGGFNLPAISNTQLIVGGTEGAPAADELALHPGGGSPTFLVTRWTPAAAEVGPISITGAIRDLGIFVDGITFQIFNSAGTSLFGPFTSSGNTPITFNISPTIAAAGNFIDFVVGANGNFNSDQSALKITIWGNVPEPASLSLLALAIFPLCTRRRRVSQS